MTFITFQVAIALNHLKAIGMIHADLKLENVMLVNHAQEPYRVKVIDFGLACNVSSAQPGAYIQTLPYRYVIGTTFNLLRCVSATRINFLIRLDDG